MGNGEVKRITAVFAGAHTGKYDAGVLGSAIKVYPAGSNLFNSTSQSDNGYQPFPSMYNFVAFKDQLGETFKLQKSGDIFHFVHLGHSAPGKFALTMFSHNDIVNIFKQNIDPKNPPYWAVILGGCWMSNIGAGFLKANIQPDFFYSASAISSYGYGLSFYDEDLKKIDKNSDGVATLRERGVFDADTVNSMALMFSKRGSPDVDIAGRLAISPYFPKEVEFLPNHEQLITKLTKLQFAEQMVVYIPARPKENPNINNNLQQEKTNHEWFVNEAKNGDGFYKFTEVVGNKDTWDFFRMKEGDGPYIFVMGPNIRYRGKKLEFSVPIGDQIPEILANEKTLLTLSTWWPISKIHKWITEKYAKGMTDDQRGLVQNEIEQLLNNSANVSSDLLDGMEMLVFAANNGIIDDEKWTAKLFNDRFEDYMSKKEKIDELEAVRIFVEVGNSYLSKDKKWFENIFKKYLGRFWTFSEFAREDSFYPMVNTITLFFKDKKKRKKELEDFLLAAFKDYNGTTANFTIKPENLTDELQKLLPIDQWKEEILDPDSEVRRRALVSLAFTTKGEEIDPDIRRQILYGSLSDETNVELRRAAAFYLSGAGKFRGHNEKDGSLHVEYFLSEEDIKIRMLRFLNEEDFLAKTFLARDLAEGIDYIVCDHDWPILIPIKREADKLAWASGDENDLKKASQQIVLKSELKMCKWPSSVDDVNPQITWFKQHRHSALAQTKALIYLASRIKMTRCFGGREQTPKLPTLKNLRSEADLFSARHDLSRDSKLAAEYFDQEWRRNCLGDNSDSPIEIKVWGYGDQLIKFYITRAKLPVINPDKDSNKNR